MLAIQFHTRRVWIIHQLFHESVCLEAKFYHFSRRIVPRKRRNEEAASSL